MEVGDEVAWMGLQWTIVHLWDSNTADGVIACLSREDGARKLGVDRCNAPVSAIEAAAQSCVD